MSRSRSDLGKSRSAADKDALAEELQAAEERLEERSGVGSASSEGRDNSQVGQKFQEQLELRSNASSISPSSNESDGTLDSVRIHGRGPGQVGEHAPHSDFQKQLNAEANVAHLASSLGTGISVDRRSHPSRASGSLSGSGSRKGSGSLNGSGCGGSGSGQGVTRRVGSSTEQAQAPPFVNRSSPSQKPKPKRESPGGSHGDSARDSGSGGTRSGSGSGANIEANQFIFNTMSLTQQQHMTDAIRELEATHKSEIRDMQLEHDTQDIARSEQVDKFLLDIAALQKTGRANEGLQELLDQARIDRDVADDARDDLKDQIAGLLARAIHKEEVHKQQVKADKKEAERVMTNVEEVQNKAKQRLQDEVTNAETNLAAAELLIDKHTAEAAAELKLKREARAQHDADLAAMDRIDDALNKANREIARRDRAKESFNLADDDFKEAHRLEDQLLVSKEAQREMHAELVASRLELLQLQNTHDEQMHSVQTEMKAQSNLLGKGGKPQRRVKLAMKSLPGGGKGKLSAIEEEFDPFDMSSQASGPAVGAISSDGGAGVGDLTDFDEAEGQTNACAAATESVKDMLKVMAKVMTDFDEAEGNNASPAATESVKERLEVLTQELEEAGVSNKKLQGDLVDMDGAHLSKIARLAEQVKRFRVEQTTAQSTMDELRAQNKEDRDDQAKHLANEKHKTVQLQLDHEDAIAQHFKEFEDQAAIHAEIVEQLQQQLYYALEAKRLESGRLLDLKRELEATEKRHQRALEDMNARLLLVPESSDDQQQLLNRLRESEQEANVLRNDIDSFRVRLQDQLEQEQLQHALTREKLQNALEQIVSEQQLAALLQEKIANKDEETRKLTQVRDSERGKEPERLPVQVAPPSPVFGFWWCQRRSQVQQSSSASSHQSCQMAMWQMLAALGKVIALQVSCPELNIKKASRRAFEVWGSSSLRSAMAPLSGLFADPGSAGWLREEISSRSARSDEFWLREVGCLEFRSKSGSKFDSVIIVAYIPAESGLRSDAAVIVVVEPMEDDSSQRRSGRSSAGSSHASGQRVPAFACGNNALSEHDKSSIASSDIGPNDSISNVF